MKISFTSGIFVLTQRVTLGLIGVVIWLELIPAGICRGAELAWSGSLESSETYRSFRDPATSPPETFFDNNLNLKLDINGSEKVSGRVLLQYYTNPPSWLQVGTAGSQSVFINQAYIDYSLTQDSLLRVGRQKISWGSGMAWNPTNYIGADKNRADLTTGFPGVDAIDYQFNRGDFSATLALKPTESWEQWGRALKVQWAIPHCDLAFSLFQQGSSNAFGADVAATVGEYTVYSELALRTGSQFYVSGSGETPALQTRSVDRHYLHGVLGMNRIFADNLMMQLEYYYNEEGWGIPEEKAYFNYVAEYPGERAALSAQKANLFGELGRNYLYLLIRKTGILEDLSLTGNCLWNIEDHSYQLTPVLEYQLTQEAVTVLMVNFSNGDEASEFGSELSQYQILAKLVLNF